MAAVAAEAASPLTAAQERSFVLCQRVIAIVQFPGWTFTLPYVADTRHYLRMCNGDIATMAVSRGTTEALTALCGGLLAPVFGSLSDAVGRRPVQFFAGCGALLRCILIPLTTSLPARMAADIFCKGVMEASLKTVKGAAHSDVFGTRPERSGEVRATEDMWSQLLSMLSPSFAEFLARYFGDGATFIAGGAAAALGMLATVICPETLPKKSRRQFALERANPVSGVWVLLSHGRRLRQLTLATAVNRLAVNINIMMLESYRLGTLGWVPLDLSRYKQSITWMHGGVQGIMIPRIIRRYGIYLHTHKIECDNAFCQRKRWLLQDKLPVRKETQEIMTILVSNRQPPRRRNCGHGAWIWDHSVGQRLQALPWVSEPSAKSLRLEHLIMTLSTSRDDLSLMI
jgi:MFS family permease